MPLPYPEQATSYDGAVIDQNIVERLKAQPAADFLRFDLLPTGGYIMQAKIPEWGRSESGQNYRIRANMNYFMRGLIRSCLDKHGNLDTRKAEATIEAIGEALGNNEALPRKFLELCNIPEQHQEDFQNFIADCGALITANAFGVLDKFTEQIDSLRIYRHALKNYKNSKDPEQVRLLRESYPDYLNTLQNYQDMVNANPETEQRIMFPMDCLSYAASNGFFLERVNRYRSAQNLPQIKDYKQYELHFKDQKEDPGKNTYRAFLDHGYFTFKVDIGRESKVLSLETTAPPAGKLLFHPGNSNTGVGIYKDAEAIKEYHTARNLVTIPDKESFDKLKRSKREDFETIRTLNRDEEYEAELDLRWEQMIADAKGGNDAALKESIRKAAQVPTKRLEWMDIEAAAKEGQQREESLLREVQSAVEQHPDAGIDRPRITVKETLKQLTKISGEYVRLAKGDLELTDIIGKIRQYADMDVTAVKGDYKGEQTLFAQIWSKLDAYQKQKEAEQMYTDSDRPENRGRYLVSSNLHALFSNLRAGTLDVDKMPKGTVHVDGTKYPIRTSRNLKDDKFIRLPDDAPLFPHDPSPNDISQGQLGDCYLLAGLSTLASRFPEKIRESMVDNGDGTVTVRFFQKQHDEQTGQELPPKPVLVTVDKVVPEKGGSESCLWAQMIERAYLASGLHLDLNPYAEHVPSDLKDRYKRYASLPKSEWPGHEKCPWLFDEENNLVQWAPDYTMIESGHSSTFLEQFLGPDAPGEIYNLKESRDAAAASKVDSGRVPQHLCKMLFDKWRVGKQIELENGGNSALTLTKEMLAHVLFDRTEPIDASSQDGQFVTNLDMLVMIAIAKNNGMNGKESDDSNALKKAFDEVKSLLTQQSDSDDTALKMYCANLKSHPNYKELTERYLKLIEPELDPIIAAAEVPKPFSGKYTAFDQKVQKNIEDALAKGGIVNAGTPGKTDASIVDGIYKRHAYSVLGIETKKVDPNGPELTFVKVRNPHGGTFGREYYLGEHGEVLKRGSKTAEGGVFYIELADFCSEFDNINYTKLSDKILEKDAGVPEAEKAAEQPEQPEPQKKQPEQQAEQPHVREKDAKFIGDTLDRYGKELRRINAGLQATNKGRKDSENSKEFNALVKALPEFLREYLHSNLRGKTVKSAGSAFSSSDLYNAATAYKEYSQKPENHRIGNRRATRVEMTNQLLDLYSAMHEGMEDPAEYCKNVIGGLIYDGLKESQMNANPVEVREAIGQVYNNSTYRKHAIGSIQASPAFAKLTAGKSFTELSRMSRKSMMDTYVKFLKAQQQVAQEEAAMKKQQARNAQRNLSNNGPKINAFNK